MKQNIIIHDDSEEIQLKDLESLADFGSDYWQKGEPITPAVSKQLLRTVANSSRTVDAVVARKTNDIANAGYRFIPAPGFDNPKDDHKKKLQEFFSKPNTEDVSDEWLESFTYDLVLQHDAFIEKVGTSDQFNEESRMAWFGGQLIGIWHVSSETILPLIQNETGQLTLDEKEMAYEQKIGDRIKQFNPKKILRMSRFRKGRANGQSPLLSLLNVIAGQINLTGYIGNLYNGNIPKTLINVGKKNAPEFARLLATMQQQMNRAQNPYGMMAVNVEKGFHVEKLMDSAESGKFLETLRFYREEIASVFGVPPSKMGWAVPGKLGSQTDMDDTYYDDIERLQTKIEKMIYNGIIRDLGYEDWIFKFNRIRPKQIKIESEARAKNARAIQVGRQEGIVKPNECREWLELDPIDEDWAKNPRHPSPTVMAKQPEEPAPEEEEEPEKEEESKMIDIFGTVEQSRKGKPARTPPTKEQLQFIENLKKFQETQQPIIDDWIMDYAEDSGKRILNAITDARKSLETKAAITLEEYRKALSGAGLEIEKMEVRGNKGLRAPTEKVYKNSISWVGEENDVDVSFNRTDKAVMDFYQNKYFPPAFERLTTDATPYNYKNTIKSILDKSLKEKWNWPKIVREMEGYLNVNGEQFPRWMYKRIVRSELARFTVEGHIRGHVKMGFTRFRRLETIDILTSKDLCEPFENWIYGAKEASGIIPAHPSCRGDMTPEPD